MPPFPLKPILLNKTSAHRQADHSEIKPKSELRPTPLVKRRAVPRLLGYKPNKQSFLSQANNIRDLSFIERKYSEKKIQKHKTGSQKKLDLANRNNSLALELAKADYRTTSNSKSYALTTTHKESAGRNGQFIEEGTVRELEKLKEQSYAEIIDENFANWALQSHPEKEKLLQQIDNFQVQRENFIIPGDDSPRMESPRILNESSLLMNKPEQISGELITELKAFPKEFHDFKEVFADSRVQKGSESKKKKTVGREGSKGCRQDELHQTRDARMAHSSALTRSGSSKVKREVLNGTMKEYENIGTVRYVKESPMKRKLVKQGKAGSYRQLKQYNSSGYSLSQSDIEAVKELSNKLNAEMSGEPLERIKQRIDEQISEIFSSDAKGKQKNSLRVSRNSLAIKDTGDDYRKSEDLKTMKETLGLSKTKCEIPSLKFERKPSNFGYESVLNSITDRERKPVKSKVNTSFKAKRVIGGSTTSRKMVIENQRMRASLNGLKRTLTDTKPVTNLQLTEEEKQIFGERFPDGYKKLRLLGRGGCAIVWLALNESNNKRVALKQFPVGKKQNSALIESCKNQITIGALFHEKSKDALSNLGLENISKLTGIKQDSKQDQWLEYELGGTPLTKLLYELKGEFLNGERIYNVVPQTLYERFKEQPQMFKEFLRQVLRALVASTTRGIVHADIKPDNILVEIQDEKIKNVKVIDFGSSFLYASPPLSIPQGTPEYMPPQAFQIEASEENLPMLCKVSPSWSYDIWSLGAIWLEIATGFPLWLSLKSKIEIPSGYSILGKGFFAVPGRQHAKILQKQTTLLKLGVKKCGERYFESLPWMKSSYSALDLLQRMLTMNPKMRISPLEALNHDFLQEVVHPRSSEQGL